jgi:hypothetical protein
LPQDDRYVLLTARRNPACSAVHIRNALRQVDGHLVELLWAREHSLWDDEWNHVLFGDESCFGRVRSRQGERYLQRFIQGTVPFRSGSIMVWGGVCLGGRTDLLICQRTMCK